jgi:hypothetical protein
MKALRSFETSETIYPTTQRHVPEDMSLQQHRCASLKSHDDDADDKYDDFSVDVYTYNGINGDTDNVFEEDVFYQTAYNE